MPLIKKNFCLLAIYLFIVMLSMYRLIAQEQGDVLFHIERSRDVDKIYYEAHLSPGGQLDTKAPIMVYWIKHSKNDQQSPLTGIQNRFGYGLNYKSITPDEALFQLVSFPDQELTLRKDNSGRFRVFTHSPEGEIELTQISIYFANNSFWSPDISQLDLQGISTKTGEYIIDSIIK